MEIPTSIYVLVLIGDGWARKYTYWPKKDGSKPKKLQDQIDFWTSSNKHMDEKLDPWGRRGTHYWGQVKIICEHIALTDVLSRESNEEAR